MVGENRAFPLLTPFFPLNHKHHEANLPPYLSLPMSSQKKAKIFQATEDQNSKRFSYQLKLVAYRKRSNRFTHIAISGSMSTLALSDILPQLW